MHFQENIIPPHGAIWANTGVQNVCHAKMARPLYPIIAQLPGVNSLGRN